MKVLIIGQGGREHALAWKIKQSPLVKKIYITPGNGGTQELGENIPLSPTDYKGLLGWAKNNEIDLTIIGPEQPLVDGLVDMFKTAGLTVFGPCQAAAKLEGSKVFAKELMSEVGVPTATFITTNELSKVQEYLANHKGPYVLKADGLAAGKGVIICQGAKEAYDAAYRVLKENCFGQAGQQIILEEYLVGREASILALVEGQNYILLDPSRDYQKIEDGDQGLNTGGMGAYSPLEDLTVQLKEQICLEVLEPTLRGLKKRGIDFQGILYIGLILTDAGPKVLEFNVRFGDPETQVLLPRLESDLVPYLLGAAKGQLPKEPLTWSPKFGLCVVLASGGYPQNYETGYPINGLANLSPKVLAFHSGTKNSDNVLLTNGGRVLTLACLADNLIDARDLIYGEIKKISFQDMHYRRDIGRNDK